MVYVTGDLHADLDRYKSKAFKRLQKGDTLIVCGDFGFVWDDSKRERRRLDWIGRRRFTTLFVEGTHDNLDLLAAYPTVQYAGGRARQLRPRCYQLVRGEIYTIEGETVLAFGGGESDDMDTREEGKTWWAGELPTQVELDHARENLARHDNAVDYVITHQAPPVVVGFLDMDRSHTNQLAAFLDEVSHNVPYQHWFFGCYHLDKIIPPRHHIVYQALLPLQTPR